MDNNYNPNPNPYPYQYPYPNSYPTNPNPHPLSASHSFSYASAGGPPPPTSFSGPLYYPPPYSHPYPPPPSQPYPPPPSHHHANFQQYSPAPPSRSDSFPGYHRQDSSDSNSNSNSYYSSSSSSLYPPIIGDPASEPQSPSYYSGEYHSGPLPASGESPSYYSGEYDCGPLPPGSGESHTPNNNYYVGHGNYDHYLLPSGGGALVPAAEARPPKASLRVVLLHGNLDVWVYEARNLPNMDMFSKTLRDMIGALPGGVGGKIDGQMARSHTTSDPYVSISVSNAVLGRTFVISNSENPVWMQHFHVPVAHYAAEVRFVVKDSDVVGSQLIGTVSIPAERIRSGERVEGVYPILNTNNKPAKEGATLRLSIMYVPIEDQGRYYPGVGAGGQYCGVPGTYFPMRRGGTVTLYQDAHVPDGVLPGLKLDNGLVYEHGRCWRDVFEAISQARKLVYIVGWSVYTKVVLVRDGGYGTDCSLGDLLKAKSQEGVRVLLLIWDDPTSRKLGIFRTDGVMQTHDEETRRFFKHSSVHVLLCPRSAGKRHSWAKQQETGAIYTHHQKTVIVDADAGNYKRKIIAFVGGLDLCDGRYDTPQHHLFRTLQTVHKDDYHNPTFTGSTVNCPREPWHDLHSRIDGPAAYDVLKNFEERWLMAAKPQGINKLKRSAYDDALLRIERIPDIIGMDSVSYNENDPESWNVQIFRSIDSNSVIGFPKDPRDATSMNLVCGKNVLIDMSIHTAYVTAIRAAQHFIYIENQYFLGSSYCWSSHNDLGANNLIPIEIALKIANKIKAKERFAAYIVIPMWPEGVPSGVATQRILFWQNKTMQMMYDIIYKALAEVGLEKTYDPEDYLNFFCLGNREAPDVPEVASESPTSGNTPQGLSRKSRRFMIYVHSKGMIVDDEYVIIGSANINQRSLEGTRDSEIAMGAYQPYHTWATKNSSPHGQIYGYRMSLWAEHTGVVEECYSRPESLDCVRRVKSMGEMNRRLFAADEVTEMRGHLLKYPVEVTSKGKVRPLPGFENFPDVGGTVVGSFIAIQENLTI